MKSITVQAPAKVNLFLEVLHRREDGFHAIDSVLAGIDLHDEIAIERCATPGVDLSTNEPSIPSDESNLVHRAAHLFLDQAGVVAGLRIRLTKRIPHGSGLGGGSSDAGATLVALDRMFGTDLGAETLETLASRIGSDCPFFIRGVQNGLARITGRGEFVTPLPSQQHLPELLLLIPPFSLSTAEVYAGSKRLLNGERHDISPLLDMLAHGPFSLADLEALLFNRLQASARDTHPELAHFLDEATRCTGRRIHLTGSGSASFLLVQEDSEASMLQTSLAKLPGLRTLRARMVALDRPSV